MQGTGLVRRLAIVAAFATRAGVAHADGGANLLLPDGYALDLGRDAPMYAVPVDRDRLVSVDLLPERWGWSTSIACDGESRRPLGGSASVVRLILAFRF